MKKLNYREIDIPSLIRHIRGLEGLTQAEFGESFGFAASAVSNWETGRREAPYKILGFVFSRLLYKNVEYRFKPSVSIEERVKVLKAIKFQARAGVISVDIYDAYPDLQTYFEPID